VRYVSPRVIRGNRGDLVSRYGILSALNQRGISDIAVFCHKPDDIGRLPYPTVPYGGLYNLFPARQGIQALHHADAVLWTAGLDLQDDSSLAKLLHLYTVFTSYRAMGLRIYAAFQGAGPLRTQWGRIMARLILNLVDGFIARDAGSYNLVDSFNSRTRLILGHDGIFLGNFDLSAISPNEQDAVEALIGHPLGMPLVGFNLRQWFHFSSSILPYQYAQKCYLQRSLTAMERYISASVALVTALRKDLGARVLLISMYEPGVEPWEDDLPWLSRVKACFNDDEHVLLVEQPLTLLAFCKLMSCLDLMIGTRLHSTLTALRFGVPALNISYTLKGRDIFQHLGFADWVVDLPDFIQDPIVVAGMATSILARPSIRESVRQRVAGAMEINEHALDDLLSMASTE